MNRALLLALLFPAAVMAQEPCYEWKTAPATPVVQKRVQPVNTSPKRVQKSAKNVHVRRKAKRIKHGPSVPSIGTTKPLPKLERVPVECGPRVTPIIPPSLARPPTALPPVTTFMPPVPMVPDIPWAPQPATPMPPFVFAPPSPDFGTPSIPGGYGPVVYRPVIVPPSDEQSNDLPTFPPDGVVGTRVSVPGTILLLAGGLVAIWRTRR